MVVKTNIVIKKNLLVFIERLTPYLKSLLYIFIEKQTFKKQKYSVSFTKFFYFLFLKEIFPKQKKGLDPKRGTKKRLKNLE